MGEPNPLDIIARAKQAAKEQALKGAGVPPVVTADGQESSKPVMPTVEAKAGAVPVSSTETPEQALQAFVRGIPDGSVIYMKSDGGLRRFYTRVGNELHNKKGDNVTEEAFKRKNHGWNWKVVPTGSNAASAEGPEQQAGESAPTPARASSTQAEKITKPEASAVEAEAISVEFDEFLKRPKGSEKIEMLKNLITEEWLNFYQRIFERAREENGFIPHVERLRLWRAFFLPQLKEAVTEYLYRYESIQRRDAGKIFWTITGKLEEEYIKSKE